MSRVKVLVVGPVKGGKSTIANIIADVADGPAQSYKPTRGVRILETEKKPPLSVARQFSGDVTVELWDVSGDTMYEKCWPIILKGAQGILFVYNPEDEDIEKNMEFYINQFAKSAKILPKQCMAFAHHHNCEGEFSKSKPLSCFKGVPVTDAAAEDSSSVVPPFDKYFQHLLTIVAEK